MINRLTVSQVRVGEIFKAAIRVNAAAIIVVHNHPSGDPTPSPVAITRAIVESGGLLDVQVLDRAPCALFRSRSADWGLDHENRDVGGRRDPHAKHTPLLSVFPRRIVKETVNLEKLSMKKTRTDFMVLLFVVPHRL